MQSMNSVFSLNERSIFFLKPICVLMMHIFLLWCLCNFESAFGHIHRVYFSRGAYVFMRCEFDCDETWSARIPKAYIGMSNMLRAVVRRMVNVKEKMIYV